MPVTAASCHATLTLAQNAHSTPPLQPSPNCQGACIADTCSCTTGRSAAQPRGSSDSQGCEHHSDRVTIAHVRLLDGHKCSSGLTLPIPADAHCGSITVQVTRVWVDSGAYASTAAPFPAGPRRSAGGGQAGGHRCRPGGLRRSHRAGRPHHQQRVRHSDVPVRWRGRLGHRLQAAPGRPAIGATQDAQR